MSYTPGLNGGRINATIGGNTAGAGALISTGTMNLAGGNNITLSQNGQSLTISGPNQSAQPGIQSIQVSNTTYTTGNVIFSNANNITFGSSGGGAITASYSQSVQTQNLMTVNGTQGAVSISGGNNVTVGNNASTITISAANQTIQTQNLHNVTLSGNTAGVMAQISSGTLSLAGGNNITLSQNGNAVTISGGAGGGGGVANAAGTQTATSGTVNFANSNGISFGMSGSNQITASYTVPSQTNQTLSFAATGNTTGNTTGVSVDARSLTYQGLGAASVGMSTSAGGSSIIFSSPTQSVQTQNMVAMVDGAATISSGSALFSDANGVSFGINGQTITGSVAAQSNQTVGLYAASNTTQSTSATVDARSLTFAGAGIASVGATNGSILISVPSGGGAGFSAGVSNLSNEVGSTGVVSNRLVLAGGDNITLSQSTDAGGATVTIDAATAGGNTYNYFNPQDAYVQVAGVQGQNTLHIQPMQAINVQFDRVVVPIVASITATSATATFALTYRQGLYTRNVSTLSLMASWSASTSFQYGTSNSSIYGGGLRLFTIPITSTITEGQYYMGNLYSSSSAGANALSFSQILASQQASVLSGIWGSASNSTVQYTRGLGTYSTSTAALPNSIGFTQIRGMSSLVLRQPIFYFASGTF